MRLYFDRNKMVLLALALTLLGFALRVYRLGDQSLWYDELFGIGVLSLPFPRWLIEVLNDRVHPPGYYALADLWFALSRTEFFVRYLSVFFGVVSIPLIYRVARIVGNEKVGGIAGALLVISPYHIWYSQEARMYSLLGFLALGANLYFMRLLMRGAWRDANLCAGFTLAALYTHYLYVPVLLAQLVFLVLYRKRYRLVITRWCVAMSAAGILYAPWVVALLLSGGFISAGISWIPLAHPTDLWLTLYTLTLGATGAVGNWLTFVIPLIALGLGAWGFWMRGARGAKGRLEMTRYVTAWLLVPILFVFLISIDLPIPNKRSVYHDRYFIAELPALVILVALGLQLLWARSAWLGRAAAFALVIITLTSLWTMYFDPWAARDDWRDAATLVRVHINAQHEVLSLYAGEILPLAYYEPGDARRIIVDLPGDKAVGSFNSQFARLIPPPTRVWLISPTLGASGHGFLPGPETQHAAASSDLLKQALDTRYVLEREYLYPGLLVSSYRVTP